MCLASSTCIAPAPSDNSPRAWFCHARSTIHLSGAQMGELLPESRSLMLEAHQCNYSCCCVWHLRHAPRQAPSKDVTGVWFCYARSTIHLSGAQMGELLSESRSLMLEAHQCSHSCCCVWPQARASRQLPQMIAQGHVFATLVARFTSLARRWVNHPLRTPYGVEKVPRLLCPAPWPA